MCRKEGKEGVHLARKVMLSTLWGVSAKARRGREGTDVTVEKMAGAKRRADCVPCQRLSARRPTRHVPTPRLLRACDAREPKL